MLYEKGDVVLVSISKQTLGGFDTKRRPAVIVSGKVVDHALVVPVISNIGTARQPGSVLLSMESPEGKAAGLRLNGLVDCTVVATIPTEMIVAKIGQLPKDTMARIDACIKREIDGEE